MKTERKPLTKENHSVKCPHCNKDLPEEIDFCPYCMERLTPTKIISLPTQKAKTKKTILVATVLLMLTICGAVIGVSLKNEADKSTELPKSNNTYTNKTTTAKSDLLVTDTQNPKANTTNEPSSSKETKTHTIASENSDTTITTSATTITSSATRTENYAIAINTSATQNKKTTTVITTSATQSNSSVNDKTIEAEIVSRWNNANNNLYIYNFTLNDYTFKQEKGQICISQRFNNNGAKIDFKVKDNLEDYTLKIDNITNLNIMYQLCRISLATIAQNQYSDTEFYDFVSDDSWETLSENETIKNGVFFGYKCTLVLTEVTQSGTGGLDYTYYTCLLSVKKVL